MINEIMQLSYLFSLVLGGVVCYFALLNLRRKDKLRIAAAVALGLSLAAYGIPMIFPDFPQLEASALSAVLVCVFWSVYTYRLLGRGSAHILLSMTPVIALWALFGLKGLIFSALVATGFVIGYNRLYRRVSADFASPITAVNAALILWMFELFAGVSGMTLDGPTSWALLSLAHRAIALYGGYGLARILGTANLDDLVTKAALKQAFRI